MAFVIIFALIFIVACPLCGWYDGGTSFPLHHHMGGYHGTSSLQNNIINPEKKLGEL